MNKLWLQQAARIDALSLRERVFLFVSILVICIALADVLVLTPAQNAQRQSMLKASAQEAELARLREEIKSSTQVEDVNQSTRDALAAVASQTDAVNRDIAAVVPYASGGPGLENVLVQFLRRQDGLTLLGTSTLKSDAAAVSLAPAPAPAPGAPPGAVALPGAMPVGMTRQGLELRVSGPYAALVRYVKTLETAMPALRWGTLQLRSEKGKSPVLTLQVFVVGVQP